MMNAECRGGGVLNFSLGMGEQHEGLKMGAYRTDESQIWGLVELIFLNKNVAFRPDFWPKMRLLNWILTTY